MFLGMNIKFIGSGKLETTTPQNIYKEIKDFKEEVNTNVANPTKYNLFSIHTKSQPMCNKKIERFNSITYKLLCIMNIWIPYPETEVYFYTQGYKNQQQRTG